MANKFIPSIDQQQTAVLYIAETFSSYKKLMNDRMQDYYDIYKEYSTFKLSKVREYDTTFKVNKAHEVVNKILPRIMAKNPKWIVSNKPDMINELDKLPEEEKVQKLAELEMYTKAIQDYLTYTWDKYNLTEPARLWAKNMLIYGSAHARIDFAYEIARSVKEEVQEYDSYDEEGNVIGGGKEKVKRMDDYVWGEYPTIFPVSWSDLYYDPRYRLFRQQPAFIEFVNGVRLGQLKKNKDNYFNLDKLELFPAIEQFHKDPAGYKQSIFNLTGMQLPSESTGVDKNALSMKTYYGRYSLDDSAEEKLYKISVVNDILIICFEEISQIPFEQIRCFEDTETNFAWGLVEPIMGLQQELNFKKNSASTYINNGIYRSYFWSPNSGINPKDLIQKPNGIIPTTKDVMTAMENCVEVPHREINPSYFQEQNDFERQIQGATFTVDTSTPKTQQALTNTATGARIQFYDQNSVLDEVRKHFEEGLTGIGYKLLQATVDNIDENITIKKQGEDGFWEIHKEALKDAIRKYEIKIETGSSSYDTLENRRDDAIAQFNIALQAQGAGVPVNMTEFFKKILDQFENKDTNRFLLDPMMQQMMGGGMQQGSTGSIPTQQKGQDSSAAQLTEQVAQGGITAGV